MKKFFCAVMSMVLIGAFFACKGGDSATRPPSRASLPDWVDNPPQSSEYYYFVGFAEDISDPTEVRRSAVADATARISSFIFERVTVDELFNTYGNLAGEGALQEDYQRAMQTRSQANLSGIETEKNHFHTYNEGGLDITRAWVLAKIPRSTVEQERKRVMDELKRKLEMVDRNVREAEQQLRDGRVIDAFNSYLSAAVASTKVEDRQEDFMIYINNANRILANLMIEPSDVPDTVDTQAKSEVGFKLTYAGETRIPVRGARLDFSIRNNTGDYSRSASTDNNGEAKFVINRLAQVNNNTVIYARLGVTLEEIRNIEGDMERYYSTLRNTMERVAGTTTVRVVSEAHRKITSSVIAIKEEGGRFSNIPQLTSEMQSYLLGRGFTVVRFPSNVSVDGVVNMNAAALRQLSNQGIKRVFVLVVDANAKPSYETTISRYRAMYSVAAQLVDTETGELISSRSVRLSGTSESEGGVFSSFISGAARQLQRTLDAMM